MGLRFVALFVVSGVLVAGCSGGEGDALPPSTTLPPATSTVTSTVEDATTTEEPTVTVDVEPPPLTHAMFARRLDRICRKGNKGIDRVNERIEAAYARGDYRAAADIWERNDGRDEPFYARIEALTPPPEDERGLEQYLEMTRQIDVLGTRMIRALRQRDDEEITRLGTLSDRLANRRTLVTAQMGLTECGS